MDSILDMMMDVLCSKRKTIRIAGDDKPAIGGILRLAMYMKSKNAKKFRHNQEYGSKEIDNIHV